jgi:O-antigen/teichoic acid export membrane protein
LPRRGQKLQTTPDTPQALLTGTLTKYALLGVNITLGIFLMPFTVRHLGTSEYGLWMLIASMTYYFQLLDLGYGNGLVRQVAEADARGDVHEVNRILSTFVVVYAAIGLVASAGILAIIVWLIPRFPNLTPDQVTRGQVLLALMGARIAIGFPMTVFGAATTARQRFALNNAVAIVVALVNGGVTYLVLASGHGLLALVSATTSVGFGSYGLYAWTAKLAFPALRIRPSAFSRRLVRDVTAFSVYLFIIDIAIQIGFNLDNVVIGAAIGTSTVAVYAVTLRLADYQRQLCNQLNGLLFPVMVRLNARGHVDALRDMLVDGTRIALTLVVGVTICLLGFASPLIVRWMGPGFSASVVPLYFLAGAGVVLVAQQPLGNILLGTGRHRLMAFVALGEAVVNLALSVALVRRYGMAGVAAGTALPVVAANVFIVLPAACRQVGMTVARFARLVAVAPAVGAVPAILVCVALRLAVPPESIQTILMEGVIVGAVYAVAVCAFGLECGVRSRYLDHVRQLFDVVLVKMKPDATGVGAQPS